MSGTGCGDPRCRADYCRGSQSVNEQDVNQTDRLDDLRRQMREEVLDSTTPGVEDSPRATPWAEVKARRELRDRIAAALADMDGMPWSMWSKPAQDGYLLRADAVIAELGLERQAHYDPHCRYHRYVTDWEADDE